MKTKRIKKKLIAKWNIVETAEIVETEYKDKPIDEPFFDRVDVPARINKDTCG